MLPCFRDSADLCVAPSLPKTLRYLDPFPLPFLQLCVPIGGRYIVEVRLFGYDNPTQRCQDCRNGQFADFGCCDDFQALNCPSGLRCDSFFFYCLRTLSSPLVRNCSYPGSRTSTANMDDGAVDYSQSVVLGLENPLQLQGLTDAYNVSNSLVKIYDVSLIALYS